MNEVFEGVAVLIFSTLLLTLLSYHDAPITLLNTNSKSISIRSVSLNLVFDVLAK